MQEWPWEVTVISLALLGTIRAGWTWLNGGAHRPGGGGNMLCYPLSDNGFWGNNDINSVAPGIVCRSGNVSVGPKLHSSPLYHTPRVSEYQFPQWERTPRLLPVLKCWFIFFRLLIFWQTINKNLIISHSEAQKLCYCNEASHLLLLWAPLLLELIMSWSGSWKLPVWERAITSQHF